MAITDSFIESFEQFIKDYQYGGAGYIKNGVRYEPICNLLTALYLTIKYNRESFTDRAVIGYLATTAIAMLYDAPALAKTLHKFMSAWQAETDRLSPFFKFSIDLDPLAPLDLLNQLQKAFELTKNAYEVQLSVVNTQLDAAKQENAELKERCEHLAQQEQLSRTRVNLERLDHVRRLISELNNVINTVEHTEPASSLSIEPVQEMPLPAPEAARQEAPKPVAAPDAPAQSIPPLAPPLPELRQQPASSSSQSSRLFKPMPTVSSFSTELLERIKNPNLRKTVAAGDDEDQLKKNALT
ncbi:hypothetical protein [Legionella sp. CNM-4043-24]|uniref:hypothetical protein n=1 Tax=Legionella sp. CNM-4043-24 TaxID=3421646 RepID=UPI00403B0DAA